MPAARFRVGEGTRPKCPTRATSSTKASISQRVDADSATWTTSDRDAPSRVAPGYGQDHKCVSSGHAGTVDHRRKRGSQRCGDRCAAIHSGEFERRGDDHDSLRGTILYGVEVLTR